MHPLTTFVADIDRATGSHAVCMVDDMGTVLERYEVEHGAGDDQAIPANHGGRPGSPLLSMGLAGRIRRPCRIRRPPRTCSPPREPGRIGLVAAAIAPPRRPRASPWRRRPDITRHS